MVEFIRAPSENNEKDQSLVAAQQEKLLRMQAPPDKAKEMQSDPLLEVPKTFAEHGDASLSHHHLTQTVVN